MNGRGPEGIDKNSGKGLRWEIVPERKGRRGSGERENKHWEKIGRGLERENGTKEMTLQGQIGLPRDWVGISHTWCQG